MPLCVCINMTVSQILLCFNIVALLHSLLIHIHRNAHSHSHTHISPLPTGSPEATHNTELTMVICLFMLVSGETCVVQGHRLCWSCGQNLVGLGGNQPVTGFKTKPRAPTNPPLIQPSAVSSALVFQHKV